MAAPKTTSLDVTVTRQTAYLCVTLALRKRLHLSAGSKSKVHPSYDRILCRYVPLNIGPFAADATCSEQIDLAEMKVRQLSAELEQRDATKLRFNMDPAEREREAGISYIKP